MALIRVPAAAIPTLRAQVERLFRAFGIEEGMPRGDTDLWAPTLRDFLLAALDFARDQHPWVGRRGVVLDPPEAHPAGTAEALDAALPACDAPLTFDACLGALQRALPLTIVEERCGLQIPRPRSVIESFFLALPSARSSALDACLVQLVVAEERWLADSMRRDAVLREVVPENESGSSFVELDRETARTLARFLLAGPKSPGDEGAYREAASAFVELFGPGTRCFGSRDFEAHELEDPFAHGVGWSSYDASGNGSWGSTLVLAATDGLRAGYLDALWDVSSE